MEKLDSIDGLFFLADKLTHIYPHDDDIKALRDSLADLSVSLYKEALDRSARASAVLDGNAK